MKVIIIGGVAGGASCAARLRRLSEDAQIILVERGEYISYANCGLPYYVSGVIEEKANLTLQTPQGFGRRFKIDVRTMCEAAAIDRDKKAVLLKNLQSGEEYWESYDHLVLSPGAYPIVPSIPGAAGEGVFTLRNIPDAVKIRDFVKYHRPKRAVVVGGGYIGLELCENLTEAGLAVTVIEMADHVIASLDYDMACDVQRYLRSKGVELLLNTKVESIAGGGALCVTAGGENLETDMVLLCAGVRPESGLAQAAGLAVNERGAIVTDEFMQTSDKNIYAVGDAVQVKNFITGQAAVIPLAGPANKQGRIAANHMCGHLTPYGGTQGSAVLKLFDMTVATTGLTEAQAKAAGFSYEKVFTFSPSHATYYPGASNLAMKTVFELGTGKILGAQIVGFDGVDKRCDVLATAIRAGLTAFDLTELELCYAPPYSSAKDPVNMAGFVMENILTGKVKQFHWHDVEALQKKRDVTLLDVRTPQEYARGHISGFINIPLDDLRQRLDEIDAAKPCYVHCQSGLRSYIACRILTQKGIDCYNFAGSYRLFETIMQSKEFDGRLCHACGVVKNS